jgi:hypothetical protein
MLEGLPKHDAETLVSATGDHPRLHQLGQLLAFDILINNTDRMPASGIWANEGNARNVLFGFSSRVSSTGQAAGGVGQAWGVFAIDQAVISIDPSNPISR